MNCNLLRFALVPLSLLFFQEYAKAQVFGPGPSDPALFDTVINLPPDPNIVGEYESIGQYTSQTTQLNVMDGGELGYGFAAYAVSEVNISGGNVDALFDANSGSEVNISGGNIGGLFDANSGSVVNISGGFFYEDFQANSGSLVNISGGDMGGFFDANSGSVVNISGGNLGAGFDAFPGSEVNISGGILRSGFDARLGSDVELFGGEFKLNGAAFTGSTISLGLGEVFTGTLKDGSAFIFSSSSNNINFRDVLTEVKLTPTELTTINTTPIFVNNGLPNRPLGLRSGQMLTLQEGGDLGGYFKAVGATLNIKGGTLGVLAAAVQSVVNISGGTIGEGFNAELGSEVNISGGSVGRRFQAYSGSVVNISGGNVDNGLNANSGSVVNISGGSISSGLNANSGGQVNLVGTEFFLDGVSLESLVIGEVFTITERDVTLSGLLADGMPFAFNLNKTIAFNDIARDFFHTGATLTVTLVPEPNSFLLAALAVTGLLTRRRV